MGLHLPAQEELGDLTPADNPYTAMPSEEQPAIIDPAHYTLGRDAAAASDPGAETLLPAGAMSSSSMVSEPPVDTDLTNTAGFFPGPSGESDMTSAAIGVKPEEPETALVSLQSHPLPDSIWGRDGEHSSEDGSPSATLGPSSQPAPCPMCKVLQHVFSMSNHV